MEFTYLDPMKFATSRANNLEDSLKLINKNSSDELNTSDAYTKCVNNLTYSEILAILEKINLVIKQHPETVAHHKLLVFMDKLLEKAQTCDDVKLKTCIGDAAQTSIAWIEDILLSDKLNMLMSDMGLSAANSILKRIKTKANLLKYNENLNIKPVTKLDISEKLTESLSEAQITVKSMNNYTNTVNFPQLTKVELTPQEIAHLIYSDTNIENLIAHIEYLPKYMTAIIGEDITTYANEFIELVNFIYEHVVDNLSGLEKLKVELMNVLAGFNDEVIIDERSESSREIVINYIKGKIKDIDFALKYLQSDAATVDPKVDAMTELGLGHLNYVFNNIDFSSPDQVKMFNETAENTNYSILAESLIKSIVDNLSGKTKEEREAQKKERLERLQKREQLKTENLVTSDQNQFKRDEETKDLEHNFDTRKMEDEFENKRSKKELKDKRKEELKDAKHQQKLKRMESDFELSEQDRREKHEKDKDKVNTFVDKIKTAGMSSSTGIQVSNILKRGIGALGAAGVGAMVSLNPVVAAACYLGARWAADKRFPATKKLNLMSDIKEQTSALEIKLQEAERKGDTKAQIELTKMIERLKATYTRIGASIGSEPKQ